MIARALFAAVAAGTLSVPATSPLAYRFDEVKSKVTRLPGGDEARKERVSKGDAATGGDLVHTGFFARTVVSVPERATRFEIGASSRARLQGDEPGVLLVLERGRLKAIFDALTSGSEVERRVATPGALLAVRGTRYGVEVGSSGETTLAVFEGTVEVLPLAGAPAPFAPLPVRAGELCVFGPRGEPRRSPMRDRGYNERSWDRGQRPQGPPREGDPQGREGDGRQGREGDPRGGQQPPGGQQPAPPGQPGGQPGPRR